MFANVLSLSQAFSNGLETCCMTTRDEQEFWTVKEDGRLRISALSIPASGTSMVGIHTGPPSSVLDIPVHSSRPSCSVTRTNLRHQCLFFLPNPSLCYAANKAARRVRQPTTLTLHSMALLADAGCSNTVHMTLVILPCLCPHLYPQRPLLGHFSNFLISRTSKNPTCLDDYFHAH